MTESVTANMRENGKTVKLFYQDSHLKEFEAKVVSSEKSGDHYEAELDCTAFFPEGGGQYADTGTIGSVRVLDVQERDGRVLHITDGPLTPGETVAGRIDWEERFMKM